MSRDLQDASKLQPDRARPYLYLAQALDRAGESQDAVEAAQRAVILYPYNADYQKVLVDCLIAAKRYNEATTALKNYVKLFPEDSFMRKMLELAKQ